MAPLKCATCWLNHTTIPPPSFGFEAQLVYFWSSLLGYQLLADTLLVLRSLRVPITCSFCKSPRAYEPTTAKETESGTYRTGKASSRCHNDTVPLVIRGVRKWPVGTEGDENIGEHKRQLQEMIDWKYWGKEAKVVRSIFSVLSMWPEPPGFYGEGTEPGRAESSKV